MQARSETQTRLDQHGRYPQAVTVTDFRRNLAAVQSRIDAACLRVGREPASMRLLPVSKILDEARNDWPMRQAVGCWARTRCRRRAENGRRWPT